AFSEKRIPGIPLLDVIGLDEANVKATLEQLNLNLWLVVEITASPRPGLARSRFLRNDYHAAQMALHLAIDPSSLFGGCLHRLDRQCRTVHQKVEAVEPMPRRPLASKTRTCLGSFTVGLRLAWLLAVDIVIDSDHRGDREYLFKDIGVHITKGRSTDQILAASARVYLFPAAVRPGNLRAGPSARGCEASDRHYLLLHFVLTMKRSRLPFKQGAPGTFQNTTHRSAT